MNSFYLRFGDIYGFSFTERIVTIMMMLIGYTFFTATFLGGWTSVQVEHYRRHAQFNNKLSLVQKYMVMNKIGNNVKVPNIYEIFLVTSSHFTPHE